MLKRNLTGLAVALVLSTPVCAFEYEVGGNLGKWEIGDRDENTYALYGTLYLQPVNEQAGPRREFAFLAKSSYLKFEFDDLGYGDDTILSGRYFLTGKPNYFIDAALQAGPIDELVVGGGMYLNATSTLSAALVKTETVSTSWNYTYTPYLTYSYSDFQVYDINTWIGYSPSTKRKDVTLLRGAYRGLFDLGNSTAFLAEAELTLGDTRTIQLNGGYYFNRDLGIKGLFSDVDDDGTDYQTYGIQVSGFVQPNAEIYATYEEEQYDKSDKKIYRIGGNFRL